jgi:hypothetical protein
MHYNPDSFAKTGTARASWSKPALKATKLNDQEFRQALASKGSFVSLAHRLRLEGRI